ncbi:MAG: adenylate/guanylate cyclase domain-containing protein [Actinomycetota bacterium]|nr:adenylate/guanylate cyclase domain-containing protein [Actinomycetota bacterium]
MTEGRDALIAQLRELGFSDREIEEGAARGRLPLLLVDRVLQRDEVRWSAREIAEQTGLSIGLLRRLWRALGFADAEDDVVAYRDEDLEAARITAQFHAAGLDDESLVLISQVLGHGMARLADTLREVVADALLEAGDTEHSAGTRLAQGAEHMVPMLSPMLSFVLQRHLAEQISSDVIYESELATGRVDGAREMTVCFADLVGFTRFGETVEPSELTGAGRRLTDAAVEAARPPVRLVKMIGDAAMLVSPEPAPLLKAALSLASSEAGLPVRVGVASGVAITQAGDWLGAPVNLASRVTGAARAGTVLATRSVRDAAREGFAWSSAGTRRLKGIREPVRLYRVRPAP